MLACLLHHAVKHCWSPVYHCSAAPFALTLTPPTRGKNFIFGLYVYSYMSGELDISTESVTLGTSRDAESEEVPVAKSGQCCSSRCADQTETEMGDTAE